MRLRRFGDAAKLRATTLQLAELAGLSLPPRPGVAGSACRPICDQGATDPSTLWQRFDAVVAKIGVALEVADSKGTVDGWSTLHDIAHEIASAVAPPRALDV